MAQPVAVSSFSIASRTRSRGTPTTLPAIKEEALKPDNELSKSSPLKAKGIVAKTATVTPSPKKKRKTTKRKTSSVADLSTEPPKGWREVYSLVQELRSDRTAPCDHSGAEALAEIDDTPVPEKVYRFRGMLALMLSSQTKDAVVAGAMRAMQKDGVLSVEAIEAMEPEVLDSYIRSVGFHNNKTKYIKETVAILLRDYNGDIPPTAAKMMELPGIGPKMAFIAENLAWKTQSGIGIDTHMHRVLNNLGWVKSNTPEKTRVQLEAWLPHEYWADANLLWVGFGQELQQFQEKIIRKALNCSKPTEAVSLLQRCGMNVRKEANKANLWEEVEKIKKT